MDAMRLLLTALVLLVEAWAIVSILGSRAGTGRKLGWTGAVVALPVAGVGAWLAFGPKGSRPR